ncbi:TetR/AcrR family transcriptional regulator [Planotetraspora phitsanulokensis]|uniref:TetR family transcriptional regulator n=1 Tax=Planotetraspora phitsanulokensis TaxID=575192 RepID=A0A8J3XDG2_9ACTN|nr:TetR/AcrR family transcriptional regulator [Planotetraspora phitsanulokensis]GII36529.1 TetR family transcriptional regulator [Planotetraspora phitsanulokensis]
MAATPHGAGGRPRSAQRAAAPLIERRADARRNIASILDAAVLLLSRDADASVADIARAAGVGRVTLYGHFSTRADLVDAVLTRTVEQADATLDATDTAGDPRQALTRLVGASWRIVHQFRSVLQAAQRELPPERIRAVHDRILRRVHTIIDRGRRAGVFRDDLPEEWLVTAVFSLMHAAAEDSAAGKVDTGDAARIIAATLLAALSAPGSTVPTVNL